MPSTKLDRKHALVIGGSHAGLLAARVLSGYFDKVTIVERDRIDHDTTFRAGVPQGYHPHFLLARGARIIRGLFPGMLEEIAEAGSPFYDYSENIRLEFPSGWTPKTTCGILIQGFSRPFLEQRIRHRVLALDNVALVGGVTVDRLVFDKPPLRVVGAAGHDTSGHDREFPADLVVAATGRGSRLDEWLSREQVPAPAVKRIDVKVSYTSRIYQGPPDDGWKVTLAYLYAPHARRGGGILELEAGTSMALAMGIDDEGCPTDEAEFLSFAKSMSFSNMADYIAGHEPINDLHRFVDHGDRWVQVHRAKNWPERLLVIGDALCRFNPIYGQGLTVAATHAQTLDNALKRTSFTRGGLTRGGLTRAYHRRAALVSLTPWLMASSSDIMWDGGRNAGILARLSHGHLRLVIDRMPGDPDLFRRFSLVQHMLAGPWILATPSVLWRLVRRPRPAIQQQV